MNWNRVQWQKQTKLNENWIKTIVWKFCNKNLCQFFFTYLLSERDLWLRNYVECELTLILWPFDRMNASNAFLVSSSIWCWICWFVQLQATITLNSPLLLSQLGFTTKSILPYNRQFRKIIILYHRLGNLTEKWRSDFFGFDLCCYCFDFWSQIAIEKR